MYSKRIEKHTSTISEGVYYTLRKNIIDMKLEPGAPISAKEIAVQLEVSRSPIRDAILKLNQEGLVDIVPQVGTAISKIDLKRVEEERFLRESLEERVLVLYMSQAKQQDINWLKQNIDQQRVCLEQKDYEGFLNLDDEFHAFFFNKTKKNLCWDTIRNLSGHYRRIRLISLWDNTIIENVLEQHIAYVEYIENQDVSKLTDCVKKHCSKIYQEEKELLQKYPHFFKVESKGDEDNFLKRDFLRSIK